MEAELARAFQEEVRCSICMDTLMDPVTINCGHTFCRPCLRLAWEEATTPARCPACRVPSQQGELKSNVVLRSMVSLIRKASLQRFLSSEEQQCGIHRETKQMFCEEDKNLLCQLCSQAPEHSAHRHPLVERVAEEKRELILQHMEALWKKKEENQRNVANEREVMDRWVWFVNLHRAMTKKFYAVHYPGLQEEEGKILDLLLNQGRTGLAYLQTVQGHLLQKEGDLRKVYREMIRCYQQPDVELLQDFKVTLDRCECALLFMPPAMEPRLSPPPLPGLVENLNQYRVNMIFGPWVERPPLLPGHLNTSGWAQEHAALREEGSSCCAALGAQVFSSGKHYWEISVDDFSYWAVGVCRNSEGFPTEESEGLVLLLSVQGKRAGAIFTTTPLLHHYLEKPLGRPIFTYGMLSGSNDVFFTGLQQAAIPAPFQEQMEAELARAFQEEVRCPICMDTLMDPVTINCGHTFCHLSFRLTWEEAMSPKQGHLSKVYRVMMRAYQQPDVEPLQDVKDTLELWSQEFGYNIWLGEMDLAASLHDCTKASGMRGLQ
ncbi:tripartite motif-containing protein 43-like [Thomomys bottae]